jgi:hypothetical protein
MHRRRETGEGDDSLDLTGVISALREELERIKREILALEALERSRTAGANQGTVRAEDQLRSGTERGFGMRAACRETSRRLPV